MLQEKVGIGVGGESAVVQDVGCRVAARLLTLKICSASWHYLDADGDGELPWLRFLMLPPPHATEGA